MSDHEDEYLAKCECCKRTVQKTVRFASLWMCEPCRDFWKRFHAEVAAEAEEEEETP